MLNEDGIPTSVADIYFGDRDVVDSVTVEQGDIVIDATMKEASKAERKAFRLCNGTMVVVDVPHH